MHAMFVLTKKVKLPPSKSINVWSDDLMLATQRILPLSEARRAHELSQDGHVPGKIVLRVTEIQL